MLQRRAFAAFVLAAGLAAAVGCSKPKAPTVTPRSATVTSLSMMGMEVEADLSVYNPNDVALSVQSVTGKVVLDHKYEIGTFTEDKPVVLPAKKRINVKVPIKVPWGDIDIIGLSQLATSNRDIEYVVEGTAAIGGEVLNVNLPFEVKGTVTHAQLLKARPAIPPKLNLPF